MTGRKGRVVSRPDGTVAFESRAEQGLSIDHVNLREKQRFMSGEKVWGRSALGAARGTQEAQRGPRVPGDCGPAHFCECVCARCGREWPCDGWCPRRIGLSLPLDVLVTWSWGREGEEAAAALGRAWHQPCPGPFRPPSSWPSSRRPPARVSPSKLTAASRTSGAVCT